MELGARRRTRNRIRASLVVVVVLVASAAALLFWWGTGGIEHSRSTNDRARADDRVSARGVDARERAEVSGDPTDELRGGGDTAREFTGAIARGVVFAPGGGTAGADAVVTCRLADTARAVLCTTSTDADGLFELRWPPGVADRNGEAVHIVARSADGLFVARSIQSTRATWGDHNWTALHLETGGVVRGTVVDNAGRAIPHGVCWVIRWSAKIAHTWRLNTGAGTQFELRADADGRFSTRLPAGHVRVWAAAAEGVPYGQSKTGEIVDGEVTELSGISVAESTVKLELAVTDAAGTPLPDAGLRLAHEHSVQRHVSENGPAGAGRDTIHFRADAAGVIRLSVSGGREPTVAAIAAPGYLPEIAHIGVDRPGTIRHQVVLRKAPVIHVRFRTESGEPAPRSLGVDWSAPRREGFSLPAPSRRGYACPAPIGLATDEELTLALFAGSALTQFGAESIDGSDARFVVRAAGPYRVRAMVLPGTLFSEKVTVQKAEERVVEWTLPDGRLVDVFVPREDSPALRKLWVWAVHAADATEAVTRGSRLFLSDDPVESVGARARVWVSSQFTHLLFARGKSARANVSEQQRLHRVEIPRTVSPAITVLLPADVPAEDAVAVHVRFRIGGRLLRQHGLKVVGVPQGDPKSRGISTARTAADGVAVLHLRPGQYRVGLDRFLAPWHPLTVTVPAGADDSNPPAVTLQFYGR